MNPEYLTPAYFLVNSRQTCLELNVHTEAERNSTMGSEACLPGIISLLYNFWMCGLTQVFTSLTQILNL